MKNTNNYILTIISILIIFFLIESILRISGNTPRTKNNIINLDKEPLIYQKDNQIGWIHKPGKYSFLPWSNEGKITKFNINNDLSRSTFYTNESINKMLFIGGSLTQGWAVSDKDNFVSLLQKNLKNYKVKNYGVGGYGGYQSLLLLERIIKKDQNVSYVIYGFIPHHEVRNVAAGSWLYLLNKYSKRGHTSVPYSSINKSGNLIRHYPVDYLKLFLGDRLSVMAKIEKRIMKIKSRNREKKKFEISKKIIKEMKIITESNGAKFYMLILNQMPKPQLNNYKKFFVNENISSIYCPFPEGSKFTVLGDGHPNELAHKKVFTCLSSHF